MKLFFRDKVNVFFSFLSVLILIALYFLFIAKNFVLSLDEVPLTVKGKYFFAYTHLISGVLVLNGISFATGTFSVIASDFANKKVDAFLLTPTRPVFIILSYYTAGLITVLLLNSIMYIASLIIVSAATGVAFGLGTLLLGFGAVCISAVVSASIMLLLVIIFNSSTAVGVLTGVLGTFIGFACGIYMPFSVLGDGVKTFASFLPFTHFTVWLKSILFADGYNSFSLPAEMRSKFDSEFNAESIGFAGIPTPLWVLIVASIILAVGLLFLSAHLMNKRLKKYK
jgi:multidrug/hemolysin transport system permease protein